MPSIVVLNGPSSAGKTSIASAVRAQRGAGCAAISLDDFYPLVHPATPNTWTTFATLGEAMFAAASALARGGFDVIVDTVFERAESIATMRRALSDHPVRLVAVTCPVDVLDARERARGNRRIGQARDQHARVFHDLPYALTLDTSASSIESCAARVAALLA